jgi:hypothetical protein
MLLSFLQDLETDLCVLNERGDGEDEGHKDHGALKVKKKSSVILKLNGIDHDHVGLNE